MPQQTGPVTITGISSKSGEKNGRTWTLYKISASDGKVYDTFDAPLAQQARDTNGATVTLEYDARENNGYTNYDLKGVLVPQPVGGIVTVPATASTATPQQPSTAGADKDAKITRLAAQRTAAQLLPSLDFSGEPAGVIAGYRKLVEELILHAETGRWASSAPVQAESGDVPF